MGAHPQMAGLGCAWELQPLFSVQGGGGDGGQAHGCSGPFLRQLGLRSQLLFHFEDVLPRHGVGRRRGGFAKAGPFLGIFPEVPGWRNNISAPREWAKEGCARLPLLPTLLPAPTHALPGAGGKGAGGTQPPPVPAEKCWLGAFPRVPRLTGVWLAFQLSPLLLGHWPGALCRGG